MSGPDIGTLYVLANRDHSLAKVGMTRNGTPEARASDYERQHGITWHVFWSAVTDNVAEAEAAAHRALQTRRFSLVPEAREIFHVTPDVAKHGAERFVVAPAGEAAQAQAAALAPRWAAYLKLLAAAAIPELIQLLTARLRHYRYGALLMRLFNWWLAVCRRQTFR